MQPRPLGGPELRLPGVVSGPQSRQPGQHPLLRRPRTPDPRQRGPGHRARILQQQRRPDLLRGAGGRDRPASGRGDGHLPATTVALHHRRGSRQQFRGQRGLRCRPDPAADPRRDSEGQCGGGADLHDRPDHQPGPGPAGAGSRLRKRSVLLGGGPRQRARHARGGHPGARPHGPAGHLPPQRGADVPLPGRAGQQRHQPQPGRDHGGGDPRGHAGSAAAGSLGAADPGNRLLPGRVRPLGGPRYQARSERLPGRELPDGGGHLHRHLSPGRPGRRLGGHPGADCRAAADPEPPQLPP